MELKRLNEILRKVALMAVIPLICLPQLSWAQDDDESGQSAATSSQTKPKRAYLGSREHQLLEIRAALPQPSRTFDGVTAGHAENAAKSAATPEHD